MRKKEFAIKLAKFFLRYNRGSSLISLVTSAVKDVVYYGILLDLAYRYLHWTFPEYTIPVLVISAVFVYYLMGYIDEKAGFWKIQNDYSIKELTPFFEDKFKEINEKIDKINKENPEKD